MASRSDRKRDEKIIKFVRLRVFCLHENYVKNQSILDASKGLKDIKECENAVKIAKNGNSRKM